MSWSALESEIERKFESAFTGKQPLGPPPDTYTQPVPTFPADPMPCGKAHWLLSEQLPGWPNEGYRANVDGTVFVADRMQWWNKEPPGSGSIKVREFTCEFLPGLATVVGSNVDDLAQSGYTVIPWDKIPLPPGPMRLGGLERVPGITFSARGVSPHSWARLGNTPAIGSTGQIEDIRVLLNSKRQANSQPGPLTLEFFQPQRAVALEYGALIGGDDPRPRRAAVQLRAFDIDGNPLPASESDGGEIPKIDQYLARNVVNDQIGVVDREGRIAKVELFFSESPRYEQAVYRVWHEPMPIGAVHQGEITFAASDPFTPPAGELELRLPPWCDRAVAMLRGAKLSFSDGQARAFKTLDMRIAGDAIYSGPKGSTIRLRPEARMYASLQGDPACEGKVYVTVLAWDSVQAEVFVGDTAQAASGNAIQGGLIARVPDPCPLNRLLIPSADYLDQACGPFVGMMRGWRFDYHVNSEYVIIEIGNPPPNIVRSGSYGETLLWSYNYRIDAQEHANDRRDHAVWMEGAILTGRSVVSVPEPFLPIIIHGADFIGPRAQAADFWFPWQRARELGFTPQIEAEVACLGLMYLLVGPYREPIRELEVELKAERYDGLTLDWKEGMGISVTPAGGDEQLRSVVGLPAFVGLSGNRRLKTGRAETLNLRTAPTAIGLRREADQPGYLRNAGPGALVVYDCTLGSSPEDREFTWYFHWKGQRYSLDGLLGQLPLVLRPGDAIWMMTAFTPTQTVSPSTTGFVNFMTDQPGVPTTSVAASGRALEAAPAGLWNPALLDFGEVRTNVPALPVRRTAMLVSIGSTPLVPNAFRFSRRNDALSFSIPASLGEDFMAVHVTYRPLVAGENLDPDLDQLIADTNAGELFLPLAGTAIR